MLSRRGSEGDPTLLVQFRAHRHLIPHMGAGDFIISRIQLFRFFGNHRFSGVKRVAVTLCAEAVKAKSESAAAEKIVDTVFMFIILLSCFVNVARCNVMA